MKDTVVVAWNGVYLETVRQFGGAPGPIARMGAMMHLAMFDAISLLTSGSAYGTYLNASTLPDPANFADAKPDVSAAFAARKVLGVAISELVAQAVKKQGGAPSPFSPYSVNPPFDAAAYASALPMPPMTGANDQTSRDFGEAVADAMLAARQNDGAANANDAPAVAFNGHAGDWRPTGSGSALTPQWGKVEPFSKWPEIEPFLPTVLDPQSFTAQPSCSSVPDGLLKRVLPSGDYAAQVRDVQELGSAHSTRRSREQTEIAFFWANDLDGTSKPPGQLYTLTSIVARQQNTTDDLLETARLFALVGVAMADAAIVAWHVKYLWPDESNLNALMRLWRPESAIHEANHDCNPDTARNRAWQPLSAMRDGTRFSPPFPAYISGHATFAAAHAATMRHFFGRDSIAFTATTEDPHALRDENGVRRVRRFTSFSEAARENGRSRVYLGVHYQWDAEGGYEAGTKVGDYVFANLLQKKTVDPLSNGTKKLLPSTQLTDSMPVI